MVVNNGGEKIVMKNAAEDEVLSIHSSKWYPLVAALHGSLRGNSRLQAGVHHADSSAIQLVTERQRSLAGSVTDGSVHCMNHLHDRPFLVGTNAQDYPIGDPWINSYRFAIPVSQI